MNLNWLSSAVCSYYSHFMICCEQPGEFLIENGENSSDLAQNFCSSERKHRSSPRQVLEEHDE